MALTRVRVGAAATLTHTFEVGEAAADAGDVSVVATDATGTQAWTADATVDADLVYSVDMPGQSELSLLSVAWSGTVSGADVVETDTVEIVGGFFFSLARARASDSALSSTTTYTTADLAQARTEVETEAEWICDRAFVPRYRRVVLDGAGDVGLILPDADIRTIRSVSIAPRTGADGVALDDDALAALAVTADSTLIRTDGRVWPPGLQTITVEYEHGLDAPPPTLVDMALVRLRDRLQDNRSGVPDRAQSFTVVDGGTYRLTLPDAYRTGIPRVDAEYARWSRRVQSDAAAAAGSRVPAGRRLDYDPQRYAIFHGGPR